ncbi:unnamed protein product [Rotaria socialis]|uniref:Uncharacterized protein n=1 Tax=Rotaria socialis TaxID=392032 RepID=A0A817VDU6_9BILA|nr:unnamed protein product [Rotaria socialis]CAF4781247.1 unnamed protein product [Rotaria socialis]
MEREQKEEEGESSERAINIGTTTNATSATSTEAFQPRPRRMVQNFLLVWLDANIDEGMEDFQKSLAELRKIFVTVEPFTDVDQCVDYLTSIDDQKIYLITSASLGQMTVPLIHDITQLDKIFVLCSNKDEHKVWANECSKVRGIYDSRCHSSRTFAFTYNRKFLRPQLNV